MTYEPRLESSRRHLEETRAEKKLAHMDLAEDYADLWETEVEEGMRRFYAEKYRTFIGVPLERREELRAAMEEIKASGKGTVQGALERLIQANGSGAETAAVAG